jgi:adenylate kinase
MTSLITSRSETKSEIKESIAVKPFAVILLGPPGAGKGTHAGPLSAKIGLPHISTGDLFREHIQGKTELGLLAKTCIDAGNLVPDELVLNMLFERIGREDCAKGYILDGFPRTKPQAEALSAYFGRNVHVAALYFSAPDDLLVERIVGRITCKDCARPYHLKFDPPKVAGNCDQCQRPLFQRSDDQEDVVRKRLQVYHSQTQPVIDYYANKESIFRQVAADGNKEKIFAELLSLLGFD